MVEKPPPDEAPSTFAAAGRYLLDVAIFDALRPDHPGRGRRAAAHRRRPAADLRGPPGARRRAPRRPPRPRQPRQLRPRVRRLRPREPRVRAGAAGLARRAAGAASSRAVGRRAARPGAGRRGPPGAGAGGDHGGATACAAPRRSSARARCPGSTWPPSTATPCAASTSSARARWCRSSCRWSARSRRARGIRCGCSPARRCASPRVRRCRRSRTPSCPSATPTRAARASRSPAACPSAAFVRRLGEDVQPGDVAVRRDAVLGAAPGRAARRGRAGQGARPPPAAGLGDLGGRRARRARPHPGAGQVADVCSHALTAAAREAGADTSRAGLVRGDARADRRRPCRTACRSATCSSSAGRSAGARAAEVQAALDGARRARHHPRRHAPRLDAGLRPARPGRRAHVPVPVPPRHRAAAVRGAGPAADPARRGPSRRRTAARVSARLTSPVTSVNGRRGYLRGRLLREKATGRLPRAAARHVRAPTCCRRWPTPTA